MKKIKSTSVIFFVLLFCAIILSSKVVFSQNTASVNNGDNILDAESPSLAHGGDVNLICNDSWGLVRRTIISFTLPATNYGTITSITLNLKELVYSGGTAQNIHQLTRSDWSESQSTYYNYKSASAWTSYGGDYSSTVIASSNTVPAGNWQQFILQGTGATNPLSLTWGNTINLLIKNSSETHQGWMGSVWASKENATVSDRPYLSITYIPAVGTVKALVVAGGGSGGRQNAGGGGAGGYIYDAAFAVTPQAYSITVGNGGGAVASIGQGNNGGNSVFSTLSAIGGGGGGYGTGGFPATTGSNGGSGGGGGCLGGGAMAGGTGTTNQGNNGGASTNNYEGGGGGGAGAVGSNAPNGSTGGNGGAGTANSISGSSVTYAGGGGGGGTNTKGTGGAGGGGNGGTESPSTTPTNGTANTGGGGGGARNDTPVGQGGSGIVIISYTTGSISATGGTITTSGGNTIHTFTSSGTFTVSGTPTITTQAVTSIAGISATGNGNVTIGGGSTITERGVCWNTSTAPTTANYKAISSGTTGAFTASMTGLTSGTFYYVRAYAINSFGISYGNEITFTTLNIPAITTPTATSVTANTAIMGANVTSDGGAAITARGTCWGTSANPTTNCIAEGGTSTGVFTHSRTGLPSGTFIYYRGYATNIVGTGYSTDGTITTISPAIVDWNNSNVQEITLSANRSFTFINGKSGGFYTLIIKQDATGGRTVSWPISVGWSNGTEPVLTSTGNAVDLIKFLYDGTNYLCHGITLNIHH